MKIYFERSGGFMGRSISTVVDTDEIAPETALKLLETLEEVDFFDLSETFSQGPEAMASGPDELCYRVTVEVAGIQHTIEASDSNTPEDLEPLIRELDRLARHAP